MKKLLLMAAAGLAVSMGGVAGAADLARPVYKAAPAAPPCAAARFQGGYVGVHGGGVNYEANRTDRDEYLVDASTYVMKKWGYVVGGQIGYNWTTCNTLWGVELDGSWAHAEKTLSLDSFPGSNISVTSRFDGLVTGRTRAGIVLDSLLLYVTGGVAAVHTKTTWATNFFNAANPLEQLTRNEWRWGWVAGFGTEWAWSDRVSIRSEVLYVGVVDRDYTLFSQANNFNEHFTNSDSMWISRVGLNVKLGDPAVVAKY